MSLEIAPQSCLKSGKLKYRNQRIIIQKMIEGSPENLKNRYIVRSLFAEITESTIIVYHSL